MGPGLLAPKDMGDLEFREEEEEEGEGGIEEGCRVEEKDNDTENGIFVSDFAEKQTITTGIYILYITWASDPMDQPPAQQRSRNTRVPSEYLSPVSSGLDQIQDLLPYI